MLQGEKRVEAADGSKENREDQPSEDQRETSGGGVRCPDKRLDIAPSSPPSSSCTDSEKIFLFFNVV